jgi:hypothetical protein
VISPQLPADNSAWFNLGLSLQRLQSNHSPALGRLPPRLGFTRTRQRKQDWWSLC